MKKILGHGFKERTPLVFCSVPRRNFVDILRDMKSLSVPDEPRYKPLIKIHKAAKEGDVERTERMIRFGKYSVHDRDKMQRTALHFACAYGYEQVVTLLLYNNCEIDALNRNFVTPLMKAVQSWTYGCVTTLLKHGADPNHKDSYGNSGLHYAISEDNQTLAGMLLKYLNADIEQQNKANYGYRQTLFQKEKQTNRKKEMRLKIYSVLLYAQL
ncbi:putative ankyrin repeat domain-containing protein 20A5 [Nannospalax galili]|uniref:putative ankyrin repeat domain-containing protein 20A5 n=1 Tax=Nannospalax galili TaxID=1026970 RepID=UPI000819B41A|nr:putative ankyrin repeat domain-containing protein 20A5 [Nannospalax galili]